MRNLPRIILTPGEPAGIGPDVTVQIAQQDWQAELVVIADENLLLERAEQLNLPLSILPFDQNLTPTKHVASTLKVLSVPLKEKCVTGKLNPQNSFYVLRTIELATDLCLRKKADALVTGPVHKGVINDAHIPFDGHTNFLAKLCDRTDVIMLFVLDEMKVALATMHIPLAEVPKAITSESLEKILVLLSCEMKRLFHLVHPRITVCGLNPHAGEGGHLGREEIEVIIPTLNKLRESKEFSANLIGPLPADTAFTPDNLQKSDVVLAMYHDQALTVVKHLGFDRAVNVTLGLPIIRTSVDHGTALEVAGTGKANCGSLREAIKLAIFYRKR